MAEPAGVAPGTTFGGRFQARVALRHEGPCEVWRGVDVEGDTPVALRLVPLATLGPAVTQLEADIENARALVHKNLTIVLDVGHQGDHLWVATELVDGQSLREMCDAKRAEGRTMTPKGAYNVVAHVANALGAIHGSRPHGGINPANVWVNKAGRVKVGDLGFIRSIPALGRRGGPPGASETLYVAPEIVTGQPATPASDIYSLGAMLYELLTGRPPVAPLRAPSQVSPDVRPAVDEVVGRAMARDPAQRFGSAAELKQALQTAMTAPPPSAVHAAAPGAPAPRTPSFPPGPPPPPMPGVQHGAPRVTLGRAFSVAEIAGGAADDQQEHWLIQKDKLDFGPFSMAQVRALIAKGDFRGDHLIVDMDTGARKKIKDHAALKEFNKEAERRLEAIRRAQAEQVSETVEKKKSLATVFIVGGALALVGIVLTGYLLSRKSAQSEKLAAREDAADVDAFLKNVKVEFATVQVQRRVAGPRRPGAPRGGGDDPFSMDQNLGDLTQGGGGDDETLDAGVIQKVMVGHFRSLVPCVSAERRRNPGLSNIALDFVILGSGKVSAVKVNGQRQGGLPACIQGKMQSFGFPRFNGSKTVASWSFRMG